MLFIKCNVALAARYGSWIYFFVFCLVQFLLLLLLPFGKRNYEWNIHTVQMNRENKESALFRHLAFSLFVTLTRHSSFIISYSEKYPFIWFQWSENFFFLLHCIDSNGFTNRHSPLQTFGWFVMRVFFKLFL